MNLVGAAFIIGILCCVPKAVSSSVVFCYLPEWLSDRESPWAIAPSDISRIVDANLCSHISLAFSILNGKGDGIQVSDSTDDDFYKALVGLRKKNPNLKVLTSVGGDSDSKRSNIYSKMVASKTLRQKFITSVIKFAQDRGLDGVDMDWEFPTCWRGDCKDNNDKKNFATFIKEMSEALHAEGLLVTAAVSADKGTVDKAYDVKSISKSLDLINVMCYDDHSYSDGETGLNAPIKDTEEQMQYWKDAGAPSSKLVMGIPLYGKAYTLKSSGSNKVGAKVSGQGKGAFVDDGDMPYFQACLNVVDNGWTKVYNDGEGAYAYKGNQWVGYDDPAAIKVKADFAKKQGYAGMMVWDMSMDDYLGKCCGLKYPLLNAINKYLNGKGKDPTSAGCK